MCEDNDRVGGDLAQCVRFTPRVSHRMELRPNRPFGRFRCKAPLDFAAIDQPNPLSLFNATEA